MDGIVGDRAQVSQGHLPISKPHLSDLFRTVIKYELHESEQPITCGRGKIHSE